MLNCGKKPLALRKAQYLFVILCISCILPRCRLYPKGYTKCISSQFIWHCYIGVETKTDQEAARYVEFLHYPVEKSPEKLITYQIVSRIEVVHRLGVVPPCPNKAQLLISRQKCLTVVAVMDYNITHVHMVTVTGGSGVIIRFTDSRISCTDSQTTSTW